ncbi:protein RDM1-like [Primulina huaijiensis]|uniref:protein RDM1-like n=1 Tax=Primulina huaijiensis TaxID=1492673 RepID=UPI003CC72D05
MEKPLPSNDRVDISSDDSSSSDDVENDSIQSMAVDGPVTGLTPEVEAGGKQFKGLVYTRKRDVKREGDFVPSQSHESTLEPNHGTHNGISMSLYAQIPELLFRRATSYQEYMNLIPIPSERGTAIPYTSWMGLGNSIKQIYGQPLHYLTNLYLKQLDREGIGADDKNVPLDMIIHPCKAEASIWINEQIHRRTASPCHLAKLWETDPRYHVLIDAIFPKL